MSGYQQRELIEREGKKTNQHDDCYQEIRLDIKASGVFVEQKSVRQKRSPSAPGGRKGKNRDNDKRWSHENSGNEKKKAGRPVKLIKKEIRACIRFSKSEYFIIREKASKSGMNASAYIRQVTIIGQVKTRLTDEERVHVRNLVGMANNLNQLAKSCHEEGVLKAMLYFENYRNEIDGLLKKLRNDK